MDPTSALIGAGASLIGSFMNTSSAQAINTQNIQANQNYLPNLVSQATRAGISPLAALGVHAPSAGVAIPTDPGSGLVKAGQYLSEMKDPHTLRMDQLAEKAGQANIDRLQTEMSQMKLQMAQSAFLIEKLRSDPSLMPEGLRRDWFSMGGGFLDAFSKSLGNLGQGIQGMFAGPSSWSSPYTSGVGETLGR